MSKATVTDILKQIQQLSNRQRNALERRLMEQREREFELAMRDARRQAKADGITEEAIDRAVMEHRREQRRGK